MKKYIVRTPESDRTILYVPETFSDLAAASTLLVQFTTNQNLEDGYPITIASGFGNILGAQIIKSVNNTDPALVNYEPIQLAKWTASGGTLTISYISGLAPLSSYTFSLVIYAG